MKKMFFTCIFFFLSLIFFVFNNNPNRKKETYRNLISRRIFYSKLHKPKEWVMNQINEDLEFIKNKPVTQQDLKETLNTMKKNFPNEKNNFFRYRIVDNKLYQYFPLDESVFKKEEAFEKGLKTLLRLIKLPDIDLIFSNIDGIPDPKNFDISTSYFEGHRNFYLTKNKSLQAPIFTRAKSKNAKEGILVPDYFVLSELWPDMQKKLLALNKSSLWQDKIEKLNWRGASSKFLRFKVCELALQTSLIDAGFSEVMNDSKKKELENWDKMLEYHLLKKEYATLEEQFGFKYLPALDGVMCTYPGYYWRLLSNSVTFKQDSDEIQWFYAALKPYEHYIPFKKNSSDLIEKIKWAIQNDEKCKKISENATNFVIDNFTTEDIYVYLYTVLKNYSKYQKFDKKDLKKDLKKDPRWVCISNRRKAHENLKKKGYKIS